MALGGHQLSVTHSDGRAVAPTTGDAVLISMGERYEVQVTLADGVFPLVAEAVGKNGRAFGLVSTAAGTGPSSNGNGYAVPLPMPPSAHRIGVAVAPKAYQAVSLRNTGPSLQ